MKLPFWYRRAKMSFKITTISRNFTWIFYATKTKPTLLSSCLSVVTIFYLNLSTHRLWGTCPFHQWRQRLHSQPRYFLISIQSFVLLGQILIYSFFFCFWQINVGSVSGPLQLNKALSPSRNAIEIPRKSSSFLSNASSSCSSFFSRPLTPVPPLTHFPTRKMGTRSLVWASAEVSNFVWIWMRMKWRWLYTSCWVMAYNGSSQLLLTLRYGSSSMVSNGIVPFCFNFR